MTRRLRPAIVSVLIPLVALLALTCILGRADSASLEPALAAPLDAAPTVAGVAPTSATNDRDTPIVITGTGFAAVLSGTQVVTPPTVYLNGTRWATLGGQAVDKGAGEQAEEGEEENHLTIPRIWL